MILEGYSAHVYCDNINCCRGCGSEKYPCHDEFYGSGKRSCSRQRVKHGWRKVKGKDICPECIEKKIKLQFEVG